MLCVIVMTLNTTKLIYFCLIHKKNIKSKCSIIITQRRPVFIHLYIFEHSMEGKIKFINQFL